MISTAWIGTAGILAIEGSYLPQIVRLFRLKRAEEISLLFPALNLAGRLLALTYSLLRADQVFTLGFLFGAMLRLTLLLQVAWYRRLANGAAPIRPILRSEGVR
jgi:lipid-A-disaccharide synthase-like uncharacterized protein